MRANKLLRNCTYAERQEPLAHHYHNEYEMIFVRSGHAVLSVQERTYQLKAGTIAFISCYEDHAIMASEDYKRFYVIIYPQGLDQLIDDPRLGSVFRNRPQGFIHIFDVSDEMGKFDRLFFDIVREFQAEEDYSLELLSGYLKEILINVLRRYPNAFPIASSDIDAEIYRIQMLIDKNCASELRISEIAVEHFVSPQYLSRCFKKRTGYSPKQYLTNARISLAKSMLVNTNLPVQVIAFKCGFSDVNNFIRIFKKHEGLSPNKYRNVC